MAHAALVRQTSRAAFGRDFLVETCLAICELDQTFLFDDVHARLVRAATEAAVQPPSSSAVRKDLQRIRDAFGATDRLPATRGERLRREIRVASPLWDLCRHLADRAVNQ